MGPVLQFPVTGFIWYQGESNGGNTDDAIRYREQFQTLIRRWRELWQNDAAPFLFVSLANFRAPAEKPGASDWALLRESQSAALELPRVGQAITTDIGEANDIHPRNKQDVGLRLSLTARHFTYGEGDLVYSGPTYAGHVVDGGTVRIAFDHVGSGLMAKGGPLGGFAIAGADGHFVWGTAQIEGDEVVLFSPQVPSPVAVRYAWADNPRPRQLIQRGGSSSSPVSYGP